LLTESLLLQVTQLALKAGPNVGAPLATQTSMLPGKIRHLTRRPIQPDGFQSAREFSSLSIATVAPPGNLKTGSHATK
jgi:hypothetical protein